MKITLKIAIFCCFVFGEICLAGEEKTVSKVGPQRIVSLSIAGDELLWSLLHKDDQQMSRVLKFSDLAEDSRYSNLKGVGPRVKKLGKDWEKLVQMKPDLIVASQFNDSRFLKTLEGFAIPVVVLPEAVDFEDAFRLELELCKILKLEGCSVEINSYRDELASYMKFSKRKSAALVFQADGRFANGETMVHAILTNAGFVNAARQSGKNGFVKLDQETWSRWSVDVLIFACEEEGCSRDPNLVPSTWRNSRIYKNSRHVEVPSRLIYSMSARFALDAVRKLAEHAGV